MVATLGRGIERSTVQIRDELPGDAPTRSGTWIERAFGGTDEARLVVALRSDGDATIALVAVEDDRVTGHILLSPMRAPFRALGLAPLSVLPEYQNRDIGKRARDHRAAAR